MNVEIKAGNTKKSYAVRYRYNAVNFHPNPHKNTLSLACVVSFVHYTDVIMTTMASQITSLTVVYSTFYPDADQRKHQSSASLAFVWGIHRDRWIPRAKGQLRGKCFHLMTSTWNITTDAYLVLVIVLPYAKSGCVGRRYNGTPLLIFYLFH